MLSLALASLLMHASFAAGCPNPQLGETQEDCPWAEISRSLSEKAKTSQLSPADLERAAPSLYSEIKKDSSAQDLKSLWGTSINYDELAHEIIVDPAILKALAATFDVKLTDSMLKHHLSHAGMEHTYGYLFSVVKTAYGYKRARWVHGDIERGFEIPVGTFGPAAPASSGGTQFANITYFFGRIAFRNEAPRTAVLQKERNRVAKVLTDYDYSSVRPTRLEETIPSKKVTLRTDLIPFKTDANSALLIYSVVDHGTARLISGFPVTRGFVESLIHSPHLGENQPIVTRYNAYVDGVTGQSITGTRRVILSK